MRGGRRCFTHVGGKLAAGFGSVGNQHVQVWLHLRPRVLQEHVQLALDAIILGYFGSPQVWGGGHYGAGADGKRICGPVWNIRATADSNTLVQICPLTGGRRGRGVLLLLGAALLDLWGKHRSYQLGVAGLYRVYRTNLNSLYRTSHVM
jgi:hypothetical protein